ncbi:ABC transporter, periplasmmic iron binding protein [Klebsiella pneumoniae]|nr:ABC transporter, periplasmmic iron binding protein [Klebsiella pneumoniae]
MRYRIRIPRWQKLIASQADKFKGKVTTYDIEKSGLGFMLAVQDSQADANYFADLANIAKGGLTGAVFHRHNDGARLLRRKPDRL